MHGQETGGINAGAVVVALPLVVLGVILFFQKSVAPVVSAVLVGVGLVVGIGSFTFLAREGEDHHPAAAEAEPAYQGAVDAMCEAREAEPAEAREIFFDRAHGPLHVLADEAAAHDREVTATLLEAKQEVESSLEAQTDAFRRDLDRLIDATVSASSVVAEEVEACA